MSIKRRTITYENIQKSVIGLEMTIRDALLISRVAIRVILITILGNILLLATEIKIIV